ncbi:MAG: mannitol dehydrogenase family protein [Actinomycetota bacterium]|nr:mannitol dehydrogenase family protein [Actinomycetota bacterium]
MVRLNTSALGSLSDLIATPAYDRSRVSVGIVHFGVGAFHRSHQAMYVDRLLTAGETEWGICGVGVLPSDSRMRDVLTAQDDLYTLVLKHPDGSAEARVIGSIVEYLFAPDDTEAVLEKLAADTTRIVSLTVTEGGYSVDNATGEFVATTAKIAADLRPGGGPKTVFGLIAEGLRRRRERGVPPFTVMSCDNIQGNGEVAKTALTSFARLKDPALGAWIAEAVAFPNSMVDRITPATTPQAVEELSTRFGVEDEWPVVAESFEQWVLEDRFPAGRPPFDTVGVQLVDDVEPYELMKLRLLNASHQAMSYLGILAGYTYVHEVCSNPLFSRFLLDYMELEASPTLAPVPGVDLGAYRHSLLDRFASPAVSDTLQRQVVDGSERIPKFLLPVLRRQLETGGPIERSVLVIAAWSVYLEGVDEQGRPHDISDVRADRLQQAAGAEGTTPGALLDIADVFGDLGSDERLRQAYVDARAALKSDGSVAVLERLVGGRGGAQETAGA